MITRVLVGGLIFKNGKILLLKRTETKKFLPGYYDLPGGKVEPGEDPNHALISEVKEETGLDIEIVKPYNVWTDTLEYNNGKEVVKECIIEIDFMLKIKKGRAIKLSPEEHSEYKWVDKKGIPSKISPQLKKTIIKAFEVV